jgi:hypothetical protein
MVVTLGHISHICGNWKHKPKPHGAAHGANRSREILGNHRVGGGSATGLRASSFLQKERAIRVQTNRPEIN